MSLKRTEMKTSNVPVLEKSKLEDSVSPERILGSKGLRKKILQKGVSWQTPTTGDEVEVHYTVSLENGGYFDSSRENGIPFRFKLGQGEVIKGWDEGVATMRKGERAVFTVPPQMAYGENGSPPMVPPNSTLISDVEVILWYPIRDVSGDGGIIKKITREGEGWATPNDFDEVLVKYVANDESGRVVSKFDEGLEFSLANGHFCPAMSKAVKTMRKGEKAELSVKFSYGISHFGNGISTMDKPHQNLIIYLELISWKCVIDVAGDKRIMKKVSKKGEGFDCPNEGSIAKVNCIGRLEDGTVFERKGSDQEPFEYVCAEEQINEGLDRAIMSMRKGEEALVTITTDISEAPISYEVRLIDFNKEKPLWKMNIEERMEACEKNKSYGNILFREGKFQLASMKYEKECLSKHEILRIGKEASNFIDYSHSFNYKEKLEANSLWSSCYLNNAACKLKLGDFSEVSRLCAKVLEIDPFNVKALFRRSEAYIRTSDLEKAEEDIKRALTIDPTNKDVKVKQRELKDKQRKYVEHEARLFSTMISRIS